MNPFEMVTIIVIASLIASVLRSRYKGGGGDTAVLAELRDENRQQANRIAKLEERVKALESVVSDSQYDLRQQFKDLTATQG